MLASNADTALVLLKYGADQSIKSKYGATALMIAADTKSPDLALTLLDYGATDLDARDDDEATALSRACRRNNYTLVKALIDKGAKDLESGDKFTPLEYAYMKHFYAFRKDEYGFPKDEVEKKQMIKLLIESGAKVDVMLKSNEEFRTEETPLKKAYDEHYGKKLRGEATDLNFIKFLIKHGADVNTPLPYDKERENILDLAYEEKNSKLFNFLIKHGATKSYAGAKIFDKSLLKGNQATTKLLIRHGVDVNATISTRPGNPLAFMTEVKKLTPTPEIIDELIKAGIDVNIKVHSTTEQENNLTNTYSKRLLRATEKSTRVISRVINWALGRDQNSTSIYDPIYTIKQLYPEKFNDEEITRIFKETIRDGDTKSIGNMLKVHSQFKTKVIDDDDHTLASYAIAHGSPEVIKYLKQQGCREPSILDTYGGFSPPIKDSSPVKKARTDDYDIESLGSDLARHSVAESTEQKPRLTTKVVQKRER